MATNAFDFTDLFQEIEEKITAIMGSGHAKGILRDVMALSAGTDVYGKYEPTLYKRRHTMDTASNYYVESSGMSMSVENTAIEDSVFDIVESGTGYTWEESKIYKMQPFPRPYSQHGVDTFVDEWLMPEIERLVFND